MIGNRKTLMFYRRLLHTMMKVFNGDFESFHKVRLEARAKIIENKDEVDDVKIQDHIFFGEEARDVLEKNVMQANLQESGNFKVKVRKEHSLSVKPKPFE